MSAPKGSPKHGGRQKGTPNKVQSDLRAIAQQYTGEAIQTLVDLMQHGTLEASRIAASRELLDRAHGRAAQAHAGPDGTGPVLMRISTGVVRADDH